MLICCSQVHILIFTWIVRSDHMRAVPICSTEEDPAPFAKTFLVASGFFDVPS
jgi:hypothetical protein